MLNDSEDFTEPAAKKRAKPSGGLSKRAKKEVSNAVDPNNILVHPKWENAPFVTKLKALLKETPSSTDQSYKVNFKSEVHNFYSNFVVCYTPCTQLKNLLSCLRLQHIIPGNS